MSAAVPGVTFLFAHNKDTVQYDKKGPSLQLQMRVALEVAGQQETLFQVCFVTDNRYGVCPSLLRDQRTILTVVGTARWLVFSLTPQGWLLLEAPRAISVTRGPART